MNFEKKNEDENQIEKATAKKELSSRHITIEDHTPLGKLMYEGYRSTIDYENETDEDYVKEIKNTLKGQYGPCLFNCSFVIENDSNLLAASIITLYRGVPLLAYTLHTQFILIKDSLLF